jgi:hypothetical protein
MPKVIDFQAYRRETIARDAVAGAPCELQEDSGLVQIRRASARKELAMLLDVINERIELVQQSGGPVDTFRQELQAEQPLIDQFHALCPPSSAPYSGQFSQSMAMLTSEQAQTKNNMMERLRALSERIHHQN